MNLNVRKTQDSFGITTCWWSQRRLEPTKEYNSAQRRGWQVSLVKTAANFTLMADEPALIFSGWPRYRKSCSSKNRMHPPAMRAEGKTSHSRLYQMTHLWQTVAWQRQNIVHWAQYHTMIRKKDFRWVFSFRQVRQTWTSPSDCSCLEQHYDNG